MILKNISTNSFKLLLPYHFKAWGWGILIPGLVLGIVRFYFGIKLRVFDIKIFAIYSSYLETKYFTVIENHYSEEVAGLLLFIGLIFIAFSEEKIENDNLQSIRLKAIIFSIYINSLLIILSFLFIFGFGFIEVLIANLYSFLIMYILILKLLIKKNQKIVQNFQPTSILKK